MMQGSNQLNATRIYYQKYVPFEDGTTISMHVWLNSLFGASDTQARVGFYDNDSVPTPNQPLNLLTEAGPTLLVNGIAQVYVFPMVASLTNGVPIWTGVGQSDGASNRMAVYFNTGGTAGDSWISSPGTAPPLTGMPDPANPTTQRTDIYSQWIEYTPAGGGSTVRRLIGGGIIGGTLINSGMVG